MLAAARIHLSPAESRALSRAIGWLVRELGWGWGMTAVGGIAVAGWAAWTFPTWWAWIQDWMDE